MCDPDPKKLFPLPLGTPCPSVQAPASTGSRRRRLWDLPHECHCPVVGVCFPLDLLRRLLNKVLGGTALTDDYEVHVGAVAECVHRNRLSELLQGELDRRYAREIKAYTLAKSTKAVADLWSVAVRQGDVAGAFWAALTHPRCDVILQEVLCRDMHMLQHQAGATVRIDLARFNALLDENAVLARELGKVQERSSRLLTERTREIGRLTAQLMQLRAENMAKDSRFGFLSEDMAALKASIPEFEAGVRLQKKVEQLTARQCELEGQNTELRHKLAAAAKALEAQSTESPHTVKTDAAERAEPRIFPVTVYLNQKTVLCVGGRSGNVANYRDLVERVGGRFAHHDGGLEDSHNVLDASLAAADLVICQTGCISHNAYWKVKDFCKRTGTRCVFVENPSASSLARGLEQISSNDTDAIQAEDADA
jgi:hypothetical protein